MITNDVFLKGSIYNSRGVVFSLRNEDYNKVAKYYKKAIESYNLRTLYPME